MAFEVLPASARWCGLPANFFAFPAKFWLRGHQKTIKLAMGSGVAIHLKGKPVDEVKV
jgi:hypothetical protein